MEIFVYHSERTPGVILAEIQTQGDVSMLNTLRERQAKGLKGNYLLSGSTLHRS